MAKSSTKPSALRSRAVLGYKNLLVFALIFAVGGGYLIYHSFAATIIRPTYVRFLSVKDVSPMSANVATVNDIVSDIGNAGPTGITCPIGVVCPSQYQTVTRVAVGGLLFYNLPQTDSVAKECFVMRPVGTGSSRVTVKSGTNTATYTLNQTANYSEECVDYGAPPACNNQPCPPGTAPRPYSVTVVSGAPINVYADEEFHY